MCGPTKESEFTSSSPKRLSLQDEDPPSFLNCSQMSETREPVLKQVGDPVESFTEAAISNALVISTEVLLSETSQWNPELLNCDICKEVCKRAVLVPCCKIQACNGCAVLRVMGGSNCWRCAGPLRSKDLVNHKYLRIAVEMFRKNGKIDANIQAALALKQTFEGKNGVSSQKIQDVQEKLSEPLPEDIKSQNGQLVSVLKPKDTVAKETLTERSETSKIANLTDKQSRPIPQQNLIEDLKTPIASTKQSIEMSRKVILTSPPPNIVERNVGLEYPVAQSTLAGQSITRDRDEDTFSSESSISRYSARWDSSSSRFSKYGSPMPGSAQETASGAFSSKSRMSYTGGKMSKSPSVGIGRERKSSSINNLRDSRSRSPIIQYSRSRSPDIDCRWRSRSTSNQYARRNRSPCTGPGTSSRSSNVLYARSRCPNVQYGRRSRSPGGGWGRRSRSPSTGPGTSSRSSSVRYARSRSPNVHYVRRSRSPGGGWGRSRSPSVHYARRSRSPGVGYRKRSRSPSVQYARRSRSSSIGRGRRSRSSSIGYQNRNRSPGRLKRSPNIIIGSRSRCNFWKRSRSPSIHLRRRRSSSIDYEGRGNSRFTVQRSSSQSGELVRRISRSPSINLERSSRKSISITSDNSRRMSRNSSLETLKIGSKSLDRSSSESWTEVQLGRNINFRNDHDQFNNESLDNMKNFKKVSDKKRNSSLVASYNSEDQSKNPQKFVDSQNLVEALSEYREKIERLKTDQERLWLAKTQFENPVCSDPRTNLTCHGYKRKKVNMLEAEDIDSFYEFFTNPDVVRLEEVKSERRQKFYIKEGKILPMPGYIQKLELGHVEDVVSSEEASRDIIDADEFKMLIEKGFYQKFQTKPENVTRSAHKRYMKPLVAHFKTGHEEAMQFLKFYKSEFNRSQVEEIIYLEKMYNSFSLYYGKMQPLYCKTCKFAHSF